MEWGLQSTRTEIRYDQPDPESLLLLGEVAYLSALCPRHRKWPAEVVHTALGPAVRRRQVRVIRDQEGFPRAALVWAYVSDEVHEMLRAKGGLIRPQDWDSGPNLWLIDVLAPFGHGLQVARFIARNPPPRPFWYIRSSEDGTVKKAVECDITRGRRGFVKAFKAEFV